MKLTSLKNLCLAFAAGVALLGVVQQASAAPLDDTLNYTNNFDNASSTASWIYWYGVNPGNSAMVWDPNMDANGNTNTSGSLYYQATIPANNQQAWFGTFNNGGGYDLGGTHDPTKYTNIAVYVHVDPSTVLDANGNFGDLQIGFYEHLPISQQTIPASATNGWVRLVQPIDPAAAGAWGQVGGIGFRYQTYYAAGNVIGTVKMWMDKLTFNVSPVPVLPPKLLPPSKPDAGLNLFSSPANGNQYQRTSIQFKTHTGISWIGQTNVTYSFTVAKFPGAAYAGYQAHIFVIPGDPISQYNTSPDYGTPHLLWLNVQNNGNGSATAYLRYKIYETNSNANMFGAEVVGALGTPWAGQIASLNAASPVGTWSLTFNQDTNVIITGPGAVTTTVSLRPEVAAIFADPLDFIIGAQPNNSGSVGQSVVLASASITNGGTATSVLNDNFLTDTGLSDPTWALLVGDPQAVQVFGSDPGQQLVKWNLPDTDFSLQTSTKLGVPGSSWTDLTGLTTFVGSGKRTAIVPSASLGTNANFFRLIKRTFTQLQVLLPGETNAPGTGSGKTGSPIAQSVSSPTTVVVNACDPTWHIISSASDTVGLTSSDGSAFLPNNQALVNGTTTFTGGNLFQFSTQGSQTVTATDISDGSKTLNTSSSVVVGP